MARNTQAAVSTTELPSLSQLFTDTWNRLKLVGWRLVGLYVLMSVVVGGLFLVGLFGGGAALLGASGFNQIDTVLQNPSTWVSFGLIFLVTLLIAMFLANAFSAAIILAVDEGEKSSSFGELLRRGFNLIVPLFIVGLATQFLVMGGLFLLVIPGLIIAVLLSFSMFEVILGGARGLTALKNSVSIVSQNFWGILGRWAALIGIQFILTTVLGSLAEGDSAASGLFGLLSSLVSMFFGIYSIVYGVLLYRAARANTRIGEAKMTWMWPVAILGWVIGGAMLAFIARAAGSVVDQAVNNPEAFEQMLQEYSTEMAPEESFMFDGEGASDGTSGGATFESPQYQEIYDQLMEDGEISDEELNQLYIEALQLQQQPLEQNQ